MKKTKIATLRLMCIVLFALISYVVPTYAQEQALIAHILTDTDGYRVLGATRSWEFIKIHSTYGDNR